VEENKSYYAIIPANVRYDERLSANSKLLYGEITALTNEKGYCWASDTYFSELYKVSKTSIQNWLRDLERNGYITREVVYEEGTKKITQRYIKLTVIPIQENLHTYTRKVVYPIQEKLYTPIQEKLRVNNTSLNNTINNTLEYKKTNKKEKDFEELWKLYPNKKGKTNAYKKYLKVNIDDEIIKQGILNYVAYIKLKNIQPQFIKHGSTWFNQEGWNDDYSEVVENIEDKKARFEEMMKYR
jgi:DNA-binding transcriptional ArsR family regulator